MGFAYAPYFMRVGILFRHSVFDAKEPSEIDSTKDPPPTTIDVGVVLYETST